MSFARATMASNASFDPFSQSLTLRLGDGTLFSLSLVDLNDFILYSLEICINYAAQLGASLLLLIVLALLTKSEKRSSPIFILNTLSLALNVTRNILQCLYFTGPFSDTYAYFAQDYSRVPKSAYAESITATVLTFLLLVCIELSLLLQTQVVCLTLRRVYRHAVLVVSLLIALTAAGFRLALCIENSKYITSLTDLVPLHWLSSATNITTSISVFWFCAVFVTKLGFALNQRRKLGLRRFGPMQVLFIMGCQTLAIPATFSILEYTTDLPSMDSNVLTLVSIFLPLSSIWAASSIDGRPQPFSAPNVPGKSFGNTYKTNSTSPFADHRAINGPLSPSNSAGTRTNDSSLLSPLEGRFQNPDVVDLEAQGWEGGGAGHTFGLAGGER